MFQKELCRTLLAAPNEWHVLAPSRRAMEAACGLHNLGIALVEADATIVQITLASEEKANRWLNSFS